MFRFAIFTPCGAEFRSDAAGDMAVLYEIFGCQTLMAPGPATGMKILVRGGSMVLRQAKRWPRLLLVGKPRVSNWSGRRIWTEEWCFEPVRQNVERKRRLLVLRRKDEYDHDPSNYRTVCGNRCRQARASSSRSGGSGGQRSGAWLRHEGCTTVAMESTGSYWIPVKNILEQDLAITLVCARKHRPKKGDKTDFRDAMELAIHHRHGLLSGSYLPERGVVELRDLTRRRKKLLGHIRSEKNRIQKVLETANVKMGNVVSDVFGVSGQQILQALLDNVP
jgi:hypothetical protein